jgi:hypothetical protein
MTGVRDGFELEVVGRDFHLSARERAEIEHWFWFTVGKLESAAGRMVVSVSAAHGDGDGSVACRVAVLDGSGATTLAEGVDRDVGACVRRTLQRAERRLRRRSLPARARAGA